MTEHPHDYIIVGAGTAGCILANRLTASGKHRVLLLEAGGKDSSIWVRIPAGISRLLAMPEYIWPNPTTPTRDFGDRSIPLIQGKGLGGSSSINGMMYVRGQREDYDGWEADATCSASCSASCVPNSPRHWYGWKRLNTGAISNLPRHWRGWERSKTGAIRASLGPLCWPHSFRRSGRIPMRPWHSGIQPLFPPIETLKSSAAFGPSSG